MMMVVVVVVVVLVIICVRKNQKAMTTVKAVFEYADSGKNRKLHGSEA